MTLGPATDYVPDAAARQAELRAYRGLVRLFGRRRRASRRSGRRFR